MAVLVAQTRPDVVHREPAGGDGGCDLVIRVDGGYEVHQIKGFSHRLGPNQKKQIRKSWAAVNDDPRWTETSWATSS